VWFLITNKDLQIWYVGYEALHCSILLINI
jgi:hypothetical protein